MKSKKNAPQLHSEPSPSFSENVETLEHASLETAWFPPWLFQHRELTQALDGAKSIDKETLTNRLNYINFMGGHLFVVLRHTRYRDRILLKAHPEPCMDGKISCTWSPDNSPGLDLSVYDLLHLLIDDGQSMVVIPGEVGDSWEEGFEFQLEGQGFAVGKRRAKRYVCDPEISVELTQSGIPARGQLMDFSPMGFRVKVHPHSLHSFKWFNSDEPVTVQVRHRDRIFLSSLCRCIRRRGAGASMEIVLVPSEEMVTRFKKRRIRNPRQKLIPSPTCSFFHPLLNKQVQLEISDISTSGFCVYEPPEESILLQGMIIPELYMEFSGSLKLECTAQVLYRLEEDKGVRCGIVILDMDVNVYSRLSHILANALDPHAYVSSQLDLDALWELFFESGFIYPTKYKLIQSRRSEFKDTYSKLYQDSPEIAKHITYQQHGRIEGHISMLRVYEKAWMIHHHAARPARGRTAGFKVLKRLMLYLNDMHRLPSASMDYALCYYRPQSRFPDRVFGGFAREFRNPKACSMDRFTYFPHITHYRGIRCPDGWSLHEATPRERWDLSQFYDHHSGGLLLDVLGVKSEGQCQEPLESVYQRHGLIRKWTIYSLTHHGMLQAALVVDRSDLGLNLSELLNGIKIIVANPDLSWEVLSFAIGELVSMYDTDKVPVLIYPHDYASVQEVPYEKHYHLWILNVQHGNDYLEYMARKFKVNR